MTVTNMREQMQQTVEDLFAHDSRLALLLADISPGYFAELFARYPDRALNLGIMEQAMISVAAGMALEGFIPITHSITPFLIERPFEQLKDDFCYQGLEGNFISIGASYEYSTEGMTHHGPGDVQILRSLPGMQIVVPGTADEFDHLFRAMYANGAPTYYRLSTQANATSYPVEPEHLTIVKRGTQATIITVGPALQNVLLATEDLDATILYCTTVAPFDTAMLQSANQNQNIILVEPYYEGVLVPEIMKAMRHSPVRIEAIGVPHTVLSHYGTVAEHNEALGLTPRHIRQRILAFLEDAR